MTNQVQRLSTIPDNLKINQPDLCTTIDEAISTAKKTMNCISIGTIQSFNSTNQTANILLNYVIWQGSTSIPQTVPYPLLVNCPVFVLQGGGGFISFPIAIGDTCLVLFCDREIDTWFTNGGVNAPQSARVHDLNDGIALVGIRSSINPIPNYGTSAMLAYGTSSIQIAPNGQITILGNNINIKNANNSGYFTIDNSGNIVIRGLSLQEFGAWQSTFGTGAWLANTVYQAATDGQVSVIWNASGGGDPKILTGSSNPPLVVHSEFNTNSDQSSNVPLSAFVRQGDYWEFLSSGGAYTIYWLPMGTV